jgi:hydroxymethylpyrimidine pyrophosphatase-like HAD family hydrolase
MPEKLPVTYPEMISEHLGFDPKAWVVLDLDGVVLRWSRFHQPNYDDQIALHHTLQAVKEANVGLSVLTNRPPGQMAALAYELGVDYGIWVTESGGSTYDVFRHQALVTPEWEEFFPVVTKLRELLCESGIINALPTNKNQIQFEPGMGFVKTVLVVPPKLSLQDIATKKIVPLLTNAGLIDWFQVKVGKGIDIDPKGLSKATGMEVLLSTNKINPLKTPTLWVADHDRDIDAGETLLKRGGAVAAVGNASENYLDFVHKNGGLMAPDTTSYHGSLSYLLEEFISTLEGKALTPSFRPSRTRPE